MSKPDWINIKRDYVETTLTLAEVEAKWSISRGTLSARATRESWRDQRQQFAAKLAQTRQEKIIAKTAEEQAKFHGDVIKVANAQLMMIVRQMQEPCVDTAKLLKLTNALANVQRIGITAHEMGTGRMGGVPDDTAEA
jgi:succinylarginine dihydrolase